jgi:hypothetical protein
MGEIFASKQLSDVCVLVFLVGSILKVVGQVSHRLFLTEDSELGAVAEAGSQELDVVVVEIAPDELRDLCVSGNPEGSEEYHSRNVLTKARHTREQRIPEPIELAREANL